MHFQNAMETLMEPFSNDGFDIDSAEEVYMISSTWSCIHFQFLEYANETTPEKFRKVYKYVEYMSEALKDVNVEARIFVQSVCFYAYSCNIRNWTSSSKYNYVALLFNVLYHLIFISWNRSSSIQMARNAFNDFFQMLKNKLNNPKSEINRRLIKLWKMVGQLMRNLYYSTMLLLDSAKISIPVLVQQS